MDTSDQLADTAGPESASDTTSPRPGADGTPAMDTGSVVSRDGTRIGYLKVGHGPAIVVMHGSMESAHSHTLLAQALSDDFTVYLPDRRGRGSSGPHRPDHDIRTEVEDLAAVMAESGAQMIFGVSAGGLVALEAARTLPDVRKVAVYEPALLLDPNWDAAWLQRFEEEIAAGKVAAAMVTSMFGLELAPSFLKVIPRRFMVSLTERMMSKEDGKAARDAITMRKLAPTVYYDGLLIKEMAGKVDVFRDMTADVFLLSGSRGLRLLTPGGEALAGVLPHRRVVEFAGLDHGASSDPSATNPKGNPETVAQVVREVRSFFAGPASAPPA
ncbi:alpha/beta hydrolase [Actinomadura sp. DC4]|uniref:alpha/beta fold hydrolase n=1 Tax=Actinomadura sp. DC4 TaxID=3055069 RepID=UPI0025B224AC|nr:alpha/beta hydrolase [Actinomadura sp. DC4]MDN3353743.1 alpha/beta hydrolase [Actinomadura sp. DC4]